MIERRASLLRLLPAVLLALAAVNAAPALAQGAGGLSLEPQALDQAGKAAGPGSNFALAHRLKLGLPGLTDSAAAPKFSIELGYGKAAPPALGSAAPASLPGEFWGHNDERAVKADITLGF